MSTEWVGRSIYYTLADDGVTPTPCSDFLVWAQWFETAERRVAQDLDEGLSGPDDVNRIVVSTVFLGLDHSFLDGPPVLWETLVFGGPLDGKMDRYTSHAAALAGHQAMCQRVAEAAGLHTRLPEML